MQASSSNLMVDVRKTLSREHGAELVGDIAGLQGVRKAWLSPRTSRIVLVDYDPTVTDSGRILGTIVRHGFDARLVGM